MPANTPDPATGLVQFRTRPEGGISVIGSADGPWKLDPGQFGGYTATQRTARRAVTTYQGVDVVSMSGNLLLDGWVAQRAVSVDKRQLEAMASPSSAKSKADPTGTRELTPPQAVLVTGCVPLPNRWWVIASLVPGDKVLLRPADGVVLRQDYAITLIQVPTKDIVINPGKRYTARKGDTPMRIAANQLGKASRWRELKDAKGRKFSSAKKKLKIGTIVKLP